VLVSGRGLFSDAAYGRVPRVDTLSEFSQAYGTHWLPDTGPNEPVPAWDEYRQLRAAVHDYLDHEPEDPRWDDI